MKIKNLLLLGLLTMSGIEAFAATAWTKVNGVVYRYNDAAPDAGATVEGVLQATNATTVSIEGAITYPEDPSKKLKVIGFDANWYNFADHDAYDYQDVRTVTQNLSVDVSNLTGMFSDQAQSITSLKKLTLSGEYTVNNYRLEGVLNTYMTELDLSGLKGHEKVLIAKVDGNVQKITLPTQQPVEILTEAFKNGGLTELTIPSNVTVVAADAFGGTTALATLTITNDNITAIADDMFKDSPIASLSITAKELTSIGANAFAKYTATTIDLSNCPKLKTVSAGSFKANAYTEVKLAGTAIDQANFEKITGASGWLTASATSLVSITLPEAITTIPAAAFKDFTALTGITFPDAVTEIKENAFNGATALKGINLNKVAKIGASAFEGCSNADFKKLEITGLVTTIGGNAFKGMTSLEEVTVIGNFDDLGAWFAGDAAIKKITIPAESKVKKIKEGAFADATAADAVVTINGAALTEIEKEAFKQLPIKTLVLDAGELTKIGDDAFAAYTATTIDLTKCTKLATVSGKAFPKTVAYEKLLLAGTKLNNDNFVNAQAWLDGAKGSLKEISLPETITEIGGFEDFTALTAIALPASVKKIKDNGFKHSGLKSIDLSNVENIGKFAFQNCTNDFKTLTIPASVKSIGEAAFADMSKLETVTITNENLQTIDAWFNNDSKIKSLTITSNKVETIASDAFDDAPIENLTLTTPALKTIASKAFASVKITEVDFNHLTALANVSDDAFKANAYTQVLLTGTKLTAVPTCFLNNAAKATLTALGLPANMTVVDGLEGLTALKAIKLPKKATEIAPKAFKSCTALESIAIPALVTKIGYSAFEYCSALASVDFSAATALETIGSSAFASCTALTEVKIPATLAKIEDHVFANNDELAKVDFSEAASLEEIADDAFNNDPKLLTLDLDGATKLKTITNKSFPANAYTSIKAQGTLLAGVDPVTNTAYDNFKLMNLTAAKTTLEEVTLPDGLTKVADQQFKEFTALKAIGLPKAVTEIGKEAFYGSGLVGIKIKNKVETIGESAFQACNELAAVNLSEATALTAIPSKAFADCPKLTAIDFAGATKLETVGDCAFYGDGLTTVKITGSIKKLENQAFYKNALESIDFTEASALTTIDTKVFDKNPKLTAIDLSGATALTSIDATAFPQNEYTTVKTAGTALDKAAFNAVFDKDVVLVNAKETLTEITFPKDYDVASFDNFPYFTKLATVALPEGITEIPAWAFAGSNFTSFTVPATVTKIGVGAFQTCAKLANVDFSQATALTEMGEGVFANCAALTAVGLPKNLEALPKDAFKNSGLVGIKIKNRIATIGESAFQGCADLAAVNFSEATALTEIGKKAFADCPKLAAVDFAGATALTTIGVSAFNGDALTTVKVTGSIETIDDQAFYNNKLESVDFTEAAALTTIGALAFGVDVLDNSKLTVIDLDGATALTTVANDAFPKNKYTSVKTAGTKLAAETGDPAVYYDNFSGTPYSPFTKENILSASDESLTELTFPAGYKMEGYDDDLAFFKNLTSISLPADLTEIPNDAFKNANITSFVVSEKIVRVGQRAFMGSALESIDFSNASALETIDKYAFANTAKLEAVGLPKNLKVIEENVFEGSALKGIKIKNRVTTIKGDAFRNAANLAQVNFEDAVSLKDIQAGAFAGTAITVIDLSNAAALTTVAATAFPQNNYTKVLLAGTALAGVDENDVYYDHFNAEFKTILANSTASLEEITLPLELTEIADNEFENFAKLTAIGLPTPVTRIGKSAFKNSGLVGIKIKKNVETIDESAFEGCGALATVNMAEATALKTIGYKAFANCYAEDASGNAISGLTSIVIPAKVTNIGQEAFDGCKLLATADFSQAVSLEGIGTKAFGLTALTSVDLSACAKLSTLKARVFPANEYTSVKLGGTILDDASFQNFTFSGATATLAELTLPETITIIPANWFGETMYPDAEGNPQPFSALTTVAIPEGIQTIDDQAFQGAALATVDFSAATALERIGQFAFQNTPIADVAIPANADDTKSLTIGLAAFADCANLTSFTAESWAGAIANRLFQNCVSLPSIEIPAAITSVGNRAFEDCENLATVTFKHAKKADKLTKIGNYAFRNCAALTSLDLSKTKLVNLNSNYPFEGCTALAEITFPDELLTINSDGIFADAPIENFEAPYLTSSGILFGQYREVDDETGEYTGNYLTRDKDNPNTTLKTVKMAGTIPTFCFAFCTALEDAEWLGANVTGGLDPYGIGIGAVEPVEDLAFFYCTGLQTFTYAPENNIEQLMVSDDAFVGCKPYVLFATNSNYLDYVATWHKGAAPLNTTFGEVDITKVQTVQDKANANQFVAKYVNNGTQPVYIDANDAKVYSIYVDGDKAYFQALRTYDGKYIIQPQSWAGYPGVTGPGFNSHVIIVTTEAKEVSIHRMFLNELWENLYGESSIGHDDVYDSQEDDDLATVQFMAKQAAPGVAQNYLYRLTNTSGVGFGFTAFTGTTIKEGQFFIACSRKPNGAGRLEVVWLDEDGNVEGEATGINTVKNIDINDGAIYNLQGVRVDNPVKGRVYIQNGKKIVVK